MALVPNQHKNSNDDISKLLNRDRKYCVQLYEEIWHFLIGLNKNAKVDQSELMDVLASSFEYLLKNLGSGDFNAKSTLKTYAFSIAKNQFYKFFESKKQRKHLSYSKMDEHEQKSDIRVGYSDFEEEIYRLEFTNLSKKCRWILRYVNRGYTHTTIANKMGYNNRHVVKNLALRCKNKLKMLIKNNSDYQNYMKNDN